MTTTRTALLFAVCALSLVACHGPKGSPDSSVKSFYNAAVSGDFEAMSETLAVESRKKLGSSPQARLNQMFGGWKDVDLTIDDYSEDADGKNATVHFTCIASEIQNYKLLKFDCSDVLALVKEDDGKWHIILAMGRTLRPL